MDNSTTSQAATPHLPSLYLASPTARLQPSTSRWAPPCNGDLEQELHRWGGYPSQLTQGTIADCFWKHPLGGASGFPGPFSAGPHQAWLLEAPGRDRGHSWTGIGGVSVGVHTHMAFPWGSHHEGCPLGRLMEGSHAPEELIHGPADPGEARTPRGKVTLCSMPGSRRFC